jgi:hypothetical protein
MVSDTASHCRRHHRGALMSDSERNEMTELDVTDTTITNGPSHHERQGCHHHVAPQRWEANFMPIIWPMHLARKV